MINLLYLPVHLISFSPKSTLNLYHLHYPIDLFHRSKTFHKFRKTINNLNHTSLRFSAHRAQQYHVPREVPEILRGSRWCWLAWPAWGCRTLRPTVSSATSVPPLRCSVSKIRSVLFQLVGSGRNERCQCAKHEELRPSTDEDPNNTIRGDAQYGRLSIGINQHRLPG